MAKDGHAAFGKRGSKLGKEKNGRLFRLGRTKNTPDMQHHEDRQLLDHMSTQKDSGN